MLGLEVYDENLFTANFKLVVITVNWQERNVFRVGRYTLLSILSTFLWLIF